jgi:hypothetical protein
MTDIKKLEKAISELQTTITYASQWCCDPSQIPYNLHGVLQFLLQLKNNIENNEKIHRTNK